MAGPLTGRRIVEVANPLAQYCGKVLADLGADVIMVERPGGNPERGLPPFYADDPKATSVFSEYWNAGKRSVTLDLDTKAGCDLFLRLAATADAVVESSPPGALASAGLTFDRMRRANSRLVHTQVTGYGTNGPYRDYKGCNLVYYALSGFMASSGEADRPPIVIAGLLTYVASSIHAAAGTLMAMLASGYTGRGQQVSVSAQQAMVAFTTIAGVPHYLDTKSVPTRRGAHGLYPCEDGFIIIAIGRPEQWQKFSQWVVERTGRQEILDPKFQGRPEAREPHADLLSMWITEFSMTFKREELFFEAQDRHLTVAPVYTVRDLLENRHLAEREFFRWMDHPRYGRVRYPSPPYKFSRTWAGIRRPAPEPGANNIAVLCEELGVSRAELSAARARGVV